ncbi:lipoprotein signal peptidase [Neisseria dumasiana]|uniref:lipoprotein signal peptidase n=1 Tax=Neisseria dumasiana TaxID=1931275 RepID=UPI000A19137A|nr:lipoprotein signal peptidase [Neisseria dumasiana]OSI17130.1 lipoprotein signal peptidase [Neisseria dumasiana]
MPAGYSVDTKAGRDLCPHLRRISALRAARSFAYLYDMSALAVLLRLELHPHLRVLRRSLAV